MFIRNGTNSVPGFKRANIKSRVLIIPTALSNVLLNLEIITKQLNLLR